jgi:hypothetical protein
MALSTSLIQPSAQPQTEKPVDHTPSASLLSMLVLSVYAAQKTNKQFRKLKRRFLWTALKLKAKSMFRKKAGTSNDRILLYILLGIVALVLVFYYPLIALLVAAVVLILILTGTI